jgi:hypothetical protein
LQTGEHDIELVAFHRGGQRVGGHEGIGAGKALVVDMDGAVGAPRERFADDLRDPRRAGRADHDLAAMLLLQAQRLFERIGVRFVHLEPHPARESRFSTSSRRGCHSGWGPA